MFNISLANQFALKIVEVIGQLKLDFIFYG